MGNIDWGRFDALETFEEIESLLQNVRTTALNQAEYASFLSICSGVRKTIGSLERGSES